MKRKRGDAGRSKHGAVRCSGSCLVVHHEDWLAHATSMPGEVHQEGPDRVDAILDVLRDTPFCNLQRSAQRHPPREAVLAIHSERYITLLENLDRRTKDDTVRPLTPLLRCGLSSDADTDGDRGDSDGTTPYGMTRFSAGTLHAALTVSGAVCDAVQRVTALTSSLPQPVFVAARPPGHHAMREGVDHAAGGCGFCVLNHVAIGAAHALQLQSRLQQHTQARPASAVPSSCTDDTTARGSGSAGNTGSVRVAIVDFDVHHGNGTQEAARALQAAHGRDALLYASVHLHETFADDPDMDFFPGSGAASSDVAGEAAAIHAQGGVLNVPLEPLWVSAAPEDPVCAAETKDVASVSTCRRRGRGGFRDAVVREIVPRLRAFAPTLLLISAGFDGAEGDEGSMQDGHVGLDLQPCDYAWVTTQLLTALPKGTGVVSVLEGGYGSWDATAGRYDRSGLAKCCAAHVTALCRGQ